MNQAMNQQSNMEKCHLAENFLWFNVRNSTMAKSFYSTNFYCVPYGSIRLNYIKPTNKNDKNDNNKYSCILLKNVGLNQKEKKLHSPAKKKNMKKNNRQLRVTNKIGLPQKTKSKKKWWEHQSLGHV